MSSSQNRRIARKEDLKRRVRTAVENFMPVCMVPDFRTGTRCGRPTMRAAKQGLAPFHCRYHVEHKARHGSHWHPSYRAAELQPYLTTASAWIDENCGEFWVNSALKTLAATMASAGHAEPATRLRGLPPYRRARAALARLREAQVQPERLLAIYLGVSALIEEDPRSHRVQEFRTVQVAKAVHRLASGYHGRWNFSRPDGSSEPIEIHKYPRSSGRVLRFIGEAIEKGSEHVADKHLSHVLALKVARFGPHTDIATQSEPIAVASPTSSRTLTT
jgi:hypothetical protein